MEIDNTQAIILASGVLAVLQTLALVGILVCCAIVARKFLPWDRWDNYHSSTVIPRFTRIDKRIQQIEERLRGE